MSEEKKPKRNFKGVWIPKEIWESKELSLQEKVFLVEIDSLDNEENCYASNKYFEEFFGLSKGRCSQIIKSLKQKGLISIEYEREGKEISKRTIKVFNKLNRYLENDDRGIKYSKQGYLENDKENNTIINNIDNNNIIPILILGEYENVKITEFEYEMLVLEYRKKATDEIIEELSSGIKSKGYKYKDHNATIRNWLRRKGVEKCQEVDKTKMKKIYLENMEQKKKQIGETELKN